MMAPGNEEEIDAIYEGEGPEPELDEEMEDEQPEVAQASGDSDNGVSKQDAVAVVIAPTDAPEAEAPAAEGDDMEAKLAARAAELDAREQNLKRWEGRLKAAEKTAPEAGGESQEAAQATEAAVDDTMEKLEAEFAENWGPDAPAQVRKLVEPIVSAAMTKLYDMVRADFQELGGHVSNAASRTRASARSTRPSDRWIGPPRPRRQAPRKAPAPRRS